MHTHGSLLAGVACAADGLGMGPRGPPRALPAALPRARPLCRTVRHARRGRLRGRCSTASTRTAVLRRGARRHHVLRRPHHVPPAGRDGAGRCAGPSCACASPGSAPLAADLWHRLAGRRRGRAGALRHDRDLADALQPARRASAGRARSGCRCPAWRPRSTAVDEQRDRRAASCAARRCAGATGDADAFASGDWFATGDLASVADDGYVSIRGRRTELIITGGHNVYPAEVEAVLARHPGVVEVAVVGAAVGRVGRDRRGLCGGGSRPRLAPGTGGGRAGAVQVPARGPPHRRAARATRWARWSGASCADRGRTVERRRRLR